MGWVKNDKKLSPILSSFQADRSCHGRRGYAGDPGGSFCLAFTPGLTKIQPDRKSDWQAICKNPCHVLNHM